LNVNYGYTVSSLTTSSAARAQYHNLNTSAIYSLSKTTGLYVLAGYSHAKGDTYDAYRNIVDATALLGDAGNGSSSSGRNQAIVKVGMYSKF